MDKEEKEEEEEEEDKEEKADFQEKVNESGFQIRDQKKDIVIQSSGYSFLEMNPSSISTTIKFLHLLLGIVALLLVFLTFYIERRFDAWWTWVLLFFVMIGGVGKFWRWTELFLLYGIKKEFKENHGLSHKIIALIEKGLEPTIKNLQKMPRVFKDCQIGDSVAQRFIVAKEPDLIKLYGGLEATKQYYRKVAQLRSQKVQS